MKKQVKELQLPGRYGRVEKLRLKEGTVFLDFFADAADRPCLLYAEADITQLPPGETVEDVEYEYLIVPGNDKFEDLYGTEEAPRILSYVGTARTDNGYKLYHFFQIMDAPQDFVQELLGALEEDTTEERSEINTAIENTINRQPTKEH